MFRLCVLTTALSGVILSSCGKTEISATPSAHPFAGCWQSEDGLSREVWMADPSGWMFGYALDRRGDGSIRFFEQTRLEISGEKTTFVVIGEEGDSVRFEREVTTDPSEFKFVNAAHDYPQVITYRPTAERLDAEISKLDGSDTVPFLKVTCNK